MMSWFFSLARRRFVAVLDRDPAAFFLCSTCSPCTNLARLVAPWPGVEVRADSAERDQLFSRLRASGLGGAFWELAAPEMNGFDRLVVMPEARNKALTFWNNAIATVTDRRTVLYFGVAPDPSLLEKIEASGSRYLVGPCAPLSLVRQAKCVEVTRYDCFALLGLINGLPVSLRQVDTGLATPLTADQAYLYFTCCNHYYSPYTGGRATLDDIIEFLELWKRQTERVRGVAVCVGMSWWKRARIRQFFPGFAMPVFRHTGHVAVQTALRKEAGIAVWSARIPKGLRRQARHAGVPLILVEDGFIRSVGLGSDMLPPSSIVIDRRGIYFDPSKPSDLEHILQNIRIDEGLCQRAARLREKLVAANVTKYGRGRGASFVHGAAAGQKIFLVPGQVGDDLSIRLGTSRVATNMALLEAARASDPAAYILYRPHPDVDAGHRKGALSDDVVLRVADQICRGDAITTLIDSADEIHTMTSLAGFEALLRGKRVVTYGVPFYAGWGLTKDIGCVPERRSRRLSLDQLVAGTLILYPLYLDPLTGLVCSPELLIERLHDESLWRPGMIMKLRQGQGRMRKVCKRMILKFGRRD